MQRREVKADVNYSVYAKKEKCANLTKHAQTQATHTHTP